MRVSICVCTYNRAHILRLCLESLSGLVVPGGCEAEILVVDNNSTDGTKDVVGDRARTSPISIRYVHEAKQGLSVARNRALKEALGDYIGFLDDECVVKPDWLQVLIADIQQDRPLIIGGPYVGALLPGEVPGWFKVEYGNAYFLAEGFKRGFQKDFRASGGNILLDRRVFNGREFDENLGMMGGKLRLGEEIIFQERFLSEHPGEMVFYEPRMEVAHYILPQKMTLTYQAKRVMEAGALMCRMSAPTLVYQLARAAIYLSCVCPFRLMLRDRAVYPYWQNYVFERVIPRVMPIVGAARQRALSWCQ